MKNLISNDWQYWPGWQYLLSKRKLKQFYLSNIYSMLQAMIWQPLKENIARLLYNKTWKQDGNSSLSNTLLYCKGSTEPYLNQWRLYLFTSAKDLAAMT